MINSASAVLSVFEPWLAFGIVLFLLLRTRAWINRHLFGIGYLASSRKGVATLAYLMIMFPGVFLREVSRYLVAGMIRVRPAFFTPTPRVDDDGIVNTRFIHFLTLNPVFAALIAAAPFLSGLLVVSVVGSLLGIPALITSLGSDPSLFRQGLLALLARPEFYVWAYILFGIANTMIPSAQEFRASWFVWVIFGLFLVVLAAIGMFGAIVRILGGPVAQIIWWLTAVFAITFVFNLVAMAVIASIEFVVSKLTNQKIEYRPPEKQLARATQRELRTVYDLKLPVPPQVGRPLPQPKVAISAKLPAQPAELPSGPEKGGPLPAPATAGKPGLPDPGARLPVKAGESLPTPPRREEPPAPEPARPLPGAPPPLSAPKPTFGAIAASVGTTPDESARTPESPAQKTGEVKPPPFTAARPSGIFQRPGERPADKPAEKPEKSGPPALTPALSGQRPGQTPPRSGVLDGSGSKAHPVDASAPRRNDEVIDAEIVDEPKSSPRSPFGSGFKASPRSDDKNQADDARDKDKDKGVRYAPLDEA